MRKWGLRALRTFYILLVAFLPAAAIANYTMTQGAGTTFGSIVVSTIHYAQQLVCDPTTPAQCAAVSAGGAVKVDNSAVTQPVSAASLPLPTGASTSALQATNTATTAHTCSTSGYSELGCLGQIDDDVKGPIPTGANVIGFVSNDPCAQATKLGAAISLTASGQVITGVAAKKTYICSLDLISGTLQNIALVEGTGTTCATNIFGLAGGTTAATGWNLPANGGLTKGSGAGTVYSPSADTNATAANVCLLLSGTGQTSGQITYVQQ